MPILIGTLLDVNPRTVFNDWLWKLGWLTKLEKDSLQQTSSNTTQLKKRPTGSPTDQTEQTKLANERYSSLRATTHFAAKRPISQTNVETFDLETTLHLTLLTSA